MYKSFFLKSFQRFINREHHLRLRSVTLRGLSLLLISSVMLGSMFLLPHKGLADIRSDAVVVVNSASAKYLDFQYYIQPYLNNFGIPYAVLDIATTPIGADLSNYAIIIIGHQQLDPNHQYLDGTEESNFSLAVSSGTGLVNFDFDLSVGGSAPRYQFVQDIFGFGYESPSTNYSVTFTPASATHYITARHQAGESIGTGYMRLAGITLPEDVTALAMSDNQPFLAVTTSGQGRAVQWGTYDWMSHSIKGPVYGFDDLAWRSIVWAARKPFVMQGLPNFVTMRVDDGAGPFEYVEIANEFGFKPWIGVFYSVIDDPESARLSTLVNSGKATASVHAKASWEFFYYNHQGYDWPDAEIAANFTEATAWHIEHNIPISKFVVPHHYEVGTNVFQGLKDWGVEFITTMMDVGTSYSSSLWLASGPYRLYEPQQYSSYSTPVYYADYLRIPDHPEFNGQFFNCGTEIRDDAGYEWYPNNDVATTIGRGTRQTKRALDSMVLATLFTHEYYIQDMSMDNWQTILNGITSNIASYNPIYVTMDYACQYVRAMHTSNISTSTYDPDLNQVKTTFHGKTDMPTMFYLFTENGGQIIDKLVDVATFSGLTEVVYQLDEPSATPTVTPVPTTTPTPQLTATPTTTPVPNSTPTPEPATTPVPTSTPTSQPTATPTTASDPNPTTITINCWEDLHQEPTLTTTTNVGDLNTSDGRWTEFYWAGRAFPGIFAGIDEVNYGLPVIRFYAAGIPNGTYGVFANLYTSVSGRNMRYYYGYTPGNPTAHAVDTIGGTGGSDQFEEYSLGLVTIADGTFNIYIRDANLLSGSYPYFGWAWIRLVSEASPSSTATPTPQPTATATPTPAPTATSTPEPTATSTPTPEPMATVTPTPQPTATATPTPAPTATSTPEPTATPTLQPTATPTTIPAPNPTAITINCWEDLHQQPMLATTTNVGDLNASDGRWTEFYWTGRPFPGIFAGVEERNFGLSVMRFYATGILSGRYNVVANLYTGADIRYYYGYTPGSPTAFSVDTVRGAGGSDQFEEYSLGTVTITDSTFNIYIQDADLLGGSYPYFGWAWIQLVPEVSPSPTETPTPQPTATSTPTPVPTSTSTPEPTITPTPEPTATSTPTPVPTSTSTPEPTITPTPEPTATSTPTPVPTSTPTPEPTITPTPQPTATSTPTPEPTITPTPQPTAIPTPMPAPIPTSNTINCWENLYQEPVLATTTNVGDLNAADGQWTEFEWTGRAFPGIFAGIDEVNYGLPVMRFYAAGIPNGTYGVFANLYTSVSGCNMRYYYGYTPGNPTAFAVDTVGGAGGSDQFEEYNLGLVTVVDGTFNIYIRDADLLSGGYPYFGWAWVRLVPVVSP